jgi:hypothetical protein
MELLKRFEQESLQGGHEALDDNEDDPEESDLEQRFKHVDLGASNAKHRLARNYNDIAESTAPDALWSMLTSSERTKFLKALDNPSGEFTQQLLASEELEREKQEPWWEAPTLDDLERDANSTKRYGDKPEIILVSFPSKPFPNGPPLVYNMCALWCAPM